MKRKTAFIGTFLVLLYGFLMFNVFASANSFDASQMKGKLTSKGIDIAELTISDKVLKVNVKSKGNDEVTPGDILAIRDIRNEARKNENKTKVKDLSLKITGANGKSMYDGVVNDIITIPQGSGKPDEKLDLKQTENKLSSSLASEGVEVSKLKITNSELGGKLAVFTLQLDDISAANALVPNVQQIIDELNKKDGTGIYQYNMTIEDASKQTIILLTADLVYRDFYWWQSPDLGNETWTRNTPKGPAPDVQETPAKPAPSPESN